MTLGQKFEKDFKDSVPSTVFLHRLKTRASQYKGDNEIADFLCFITPNLFVMELKTTKEKRLPFDMLRPNQIIGISKALGYDGVFGGFVVQFREPVYKHFYVPVQVVTEYITDGKKSIPMADMESDSRIIEIPFTKKRTTCKFDISYLLQTIKERAHANNT